MAERGTILVENYTFSQWIAFFLIYSFLGWCIESTIVSVSKRKLTNRGFLTGPMLPLYGFGALTILISTLWVQESYVLVYICGLIAATCLEYVTGVVMEAMFNMRYWDYSDKKFNVNGYICLKSSLFWGVLSVVLVCFIHRPIAGLVLFIQPWVFYILLIAAVTVAVLDTVHAFKEAFDFQKLLAYQTMVRKELAEITERLGDARDAFTERTTEKQIAYFAKQEERIEHLRLELDAAKQRMGNFRNSMIKSFPSATSKRFGEALEEFKQRFNGGK